MKHPARPNRGIIALFLAVVIWGSTYVVTKATLKNVGPFTLTTARFAIAFAILAPLARRQGYLLQRTLQAPFLLFGLTGIALSFGLQNLGLALTSISNSALIQASIPAVTVALAAWILKERLSRAQLGGIALTVVGAFLVSRSGESAMDSPQPMIGNLLTVGSVLAWASYTVQGKRLASDYPALVLTTASIGSGLIFLLPCAAGELWLLGPPSISMQSVLAILYLGGAASALTLYLWNTALQFMPVSIAAPYTNLIPAVGLFSAVLLGEHVGLPQLSGGALTLVGVLLSRDQALIVRDTRKKDKS